MISLIGAVPLPKSLVTSSQLNCHPVRTIRRSKVACLLRTKSFSVPIPSPCARSVASVHPAGLPARISSARCWSVGKAMPTL